MVPPSTSVVLLLSFLSFAFVRSVKVDIDVFTNKIRCYNATGGPTTWWKDGEVINTTAGNGKYNEELCDGNYCLTSNFTTDDEGWYSCIDNSNPTAIRINPQNTGSSFNATFDDNGNIKIPCGLKIGSITANDSLRETFIKNGTDQRLSGEFKKESEGNSYNVFFLPDSSEYENLSNSDTYYCRIKVIKGFYKHTFSLRVPPRVTIHRDDDDVGNATLQYYTQYTGERLSVFCNASHPDANSSTSVTKKWMKDDDDDENNVLSNDSQLVIDQLSPKDTGVYTCSASFGGLEYSKSFNLTVLDFPSPSPSQTIGSSSTFENAQVITSISMTFSSSAETEATLSATVSPTGSTGGSSGIEDTLIFAVIIIVLLIAVMVLLAVMTLCYLLHCCMKRKKQKENESGSRTGGDVELQMNQNENSFRPPPTPSISSANDRLTIASSSCCDSCRCTPSIAPSSGINTIQSDQCSLRHNPNTLVGAVSNNPSHCGSTVTCTCSCTRSHCIHPAYYTTRPPPHCHPSSHPPLSHTAIGFKPVNPSISKISCDSGYSVNHAPSETRASRGYPDTQTVCSHCTRSYITSIDSGYHPMRTSSRLPGYSHNEGTVC